MPLNWVPFPTNQPFIVGHYYALTWHFGFDIPDNLQGAINWGIENAPSFSGPIAIKSIKYNKISNGNRRDGMDVVITFQALPHPTITEAGFDLRAFLLIAGAVVVGILAVNGTLKSFVTAIDDTAKTAGKVFDPAVIIGIIVIILLFSGMKGR